MKCMFKGSVRRLSVVVLFALLLAGCGGGGSEAEWPSEQIRWIVPSAAGGGFDTNARQIQPYLEEELGVPVSVENQEGGGFAIGTTTALSEGEDCNTVMFHGVPHLLFSYLTQEVDYTYDDFQPVASLTVEPGVIQVRNDAPWENLEDLIEDAESRPGEIRASVSGLTASNNVGLADLQAATDAEFNVIPYDGGGPARTALVSGEVDVTHAGLFNSLSVGDEARILAVHQDENTWPELTDDAPTVNEALGTSLPPNDSSYGFFVSKECSEQYPERYDRLVEATEAAMQNEEYLQTLNDLGEEEKVLVRDAAEYDDLIREEIDRITQLLEERPEIFEGGS